MIVLKLILNFTVIKLILNFIVLKLISKLIVIKLYCNKTHIKVDCNLVKLHGPTSLLLSAARCAPLPGAPLSDPGFSLPVVPDLGPSGLWFVSVLQVSYPGLLSV